MWIFSWAPFSEPVPLIRKLPEVRYLQKRAALYPPEQGAGIFTLHTGHRGLCPNADYGSVGQRWGLRTYASSEFQSAGPGALWVTTEETQPGVKDAGSLLVIQAREHPKLPDSSPQDSVGCPGPLCLAHGRVPEPLGYTEGSLTMRYYSKSCPKGTCSAPQCLKGPQVALPFLPQPQPPRGPAEVLGQALRLQTPEQLRCCPQVPAGPVLPWKSRDGLQGLWARGHQRSPWARRFAPHLSANYLLSRPKHHLPPEPPQASPPSQDSSSQADPETIQINRTFFFFMCFPLYS